VERHWEPGGPPVGIGAGPESGRLDAALRKATEDRTGAGVVAMAADRQRTLYQGAFGVADAATGRALNPDALFRIASTTKAIASAAAMCGIYQIATR
jgi:methyl acetate hydrolase